jgi:hypothetical protein
MKFTISADVSTDQERQPEGKKVTGSINLFIDDAEDMIQAGGLAHQFLNEALNWPFHITAITERKW